MSRVSLYLNWNRRWFQFEIDYRVVEKELNETSHNLMHQQTALQTTVPFRIVRRVTGHRPPWRRQNWCESWVTLSLAGCDKVFDENSSLSMPGRNFSLPKFGQNHASHWPLPKQNFGAVVTGHRPCWKIRNGTVFYGKLRAIFNSLCWSSCPLEPFRVRQHHLSSWTKNWRRWRDRRNAWVNSILFSILFY